MGVRAVNGHRRGDPLRRARAEERHRPRSLQAAHRQPRHAGGDHRDHAEGAAGARRRRARWCCRVSTRRPASPRCRRRWARPTASRPPPGCRRRPPPGCRRWPARRPVGAGADRGFRRLGGLSHRAAARRPGAVRRDAEILDDAASRAVWRGGARRACRWPATPADAVWRVSVRPSAGPGVLRALAERFGARGYLDWGGGLVWIAGPADDGGACRGGAGGARRRRHLDAAARARSRCAPRSP